jgi:hypothetical protein
MSLYAYRMASLAAFNRFLALGNAQVDFRSDAEWVRLNDRADSIFRSLPPSMQSFRARGPMTRDEWHRERMEQERLEDAQVEAREDAEMFYDFACAKILADAFHKMLLALCEPADDLMDRCPTPRDRMVRGENYSLAWLAVAGYVVRGGAGARGYHLLVVGRGKAMEGTQEQLELLEHLTRRLNVVLRVYGQRMKRAEYEFSAYLRSSTVDNADKCWAAFKAQARRADRMALRHHRIARRAIEVSRG